MALTGSLETLLTVASIIAMSLLFDLSSARTAQFMMVATFLKRVLSSRPKVRFYEKLSGDGTF